MTSVASSSNIWVQCLLIFALLLCGANEAAAAKTSISNVDFKMDSPIDLVRVYKAARRLELISAGHVIHRFPIALGSNPTGHKVKEGDGRTPEGRYVLDYKKSDSAYHLAIHVSYPNPQDTAAAKAKGVDPGGQIMIHGQKNGLGWLAPISQWFDWTQGCIALNNQHMDIMWRVVNVPTPIEIFP